MKLYKRLRVRDTKAYQLRASFDIVAFPLFLFLFLTGTLVIPLYSAPVNPEPRLLKHGQFELKNLLATNHHMVGLSREREWPNVTSLEFGVLDRGSFGIQYGEGVSLMGRTIILESESWVPSLALGFRQMFNSQEAHIYQVPTEDRDKWENEIYLQFYRRLDSGTDLQAGINILSSVAKGGASPFWGVDLSLTDYLKLDYEGFQREDFAHHNIGLSYHKKDRFSITAGLLEVQEWLYQDEQLGFYDLPERERFDAQFSPGIYLQIQITGIMTEAGRGTVQLRLEDLEKGQKHLIDSISHLKTRLSRSEFLLSEITGPRVTFDQEEETASALILDQIVKTYRTEPDNIDALRGFQDSLLAIGEPAYNALNRLAEHPATDDLYRETVIRIMGNSKLKRFSSALMGQLNHDKVVIRREALIALGKIGDYASIEAIQVKTKDKDPIIRVIAAQIVERIVVKAKVLEKNEADAMGAVEKPLSTIESSDLDKKTNDNNNGNTESIIVPKKPTVVDLEKKPVIKNVDPPKLEDTP